MKEIDPDGVRERRARRLTRRNFISFGPNFTWRHIDGKRYILELIYSLDWVNGKIVTRYINRFP